MTEIQIIDNQEYVTFNEATKILKYENINLQKSLRFFKCKIDKRSYIKKIDLDNLITFYKERLSRQFGNVANLNLLIGFWIAYGTTLIFRKWFS